MEQLKQAIDWEKARFMLIGARPAMGKTNFALNLVYHKMKYEKASILYFHLEEEKENIFKRLLMIQTGIDLRQGNVQEEKWENLQETIQEMKEWNLYFDQNHHIEKVKEQIRGTKMEKGLQYVIIDTWQYLSSNNIECLSRSDELKKMAEELKILAEELQICILCISQLARRPEKREDHRPMLEDFADTGKSVALADVVILLYREGYYQKEHKAKEKMEVILAKNQGKSCQTIDYQVDWNCLQIKEERMEQ